MQKGAPADSASESLKQLRDKRRIWAGNDPGHGAGGAGLRRAVYFVFGGQTSCFHGSQPECSIENEVSSKLRVPSPGI